VAVLLVQSVQVEPTERLLGEPASELLLGAIEVVLVVVELVRVLAGHSVELVLVALGEGTACLAAQVSG